MKTATLGSVSHGTMQPVDLIPTFIGELRFLARGTDRAKDIGRRLKEMESRADTAEDYYDSEEANYDLETLFDLLNEFAPPYATFGAHEGDGTDYGFWPCLESVEDDIRAGAILKIDAGDEWPNPLPEGIEYVAEVTDHGNLTLFTRDHSEVWACV